MMTDFKKLTFDYNKRLLYQTFRPTCIKITFLSRDYIRPSEKLVMGHYITPLKDSLDSFTILKLL